jgi:hypothetical protein
VIFTHLVQFGFFTGAGGTQVPAPAAPTSTVGGGRRRRSFVEIDGDLIEVSGYEEAEELLRQVKQEEKAQEADRKKLRVAVKKYEVDIRTRGRKPERPEVIEKRMDDRAEKIARLYALILENYENDLEDDEEEVLLMS